MEEAISMFFAQCSRQKIQFVCCYAVFVQGCLVYCDYKGHFLSTTQWF